ncbi:MAPEG family protein [uncultured Maricaulis sp.]|uniref:MAPEG family protein n=1 Tax=uncultured Maricaulis sp. TaxID=174710 RepID=UPI002611747A|nr:MAPEG family protein [uncultured Maricaulis sp.]
MSDALIYPLLLQVALTFVLLFANALMRTGSVAAGKVKPADIVLGQRAWPRKVQQVSNAFQNQMETPTLFFVGVILAIILGISGPVLLTLAWVWAGLRVVHAIIHTTSNHLRWRFYSFAGGVFVLLAFWITLAIGIVTR